MTRRQALLFSVLALLAAGCTVGPDYKRPEVSTPPAYRGADAGPPAGGAGLAVTAPGGRPSDNSLYARDMPPS